MLATSVGKHVQYMCPDTKLCALSPVLDYKPLESVDYKCLTLHGMQCFMIICWINVRLLHPTPFPAVLITVLTYSRVVTVITFYWAPTSSWYFSWFLSSKCDHSPFRTPTVSSRLSHYCFCLFLKLFSCYHVGTESIFFHLCHPSTLLEHQHLYVYIYMYLYLYLSLHLWDILCISSSYTGNKISTQF